MNWRAIAIALSLAPGAARADEITSRLDSLEVEVRQLNTDLTTAPLTMTAPGRHMVDAIVAYDLGDYSGASSMLVELASGTSGADRDTAIFYLGESLFKKGDRAGAATYFTQLTESKNVGSKFYQPALLRLVEIAAAQHEGAEQPLALLDQIAPPQRSPRVPYVKAKYAFSQDKYDETLAALAEVPAGSELVLEVEYLAATVHVAKQDYPKAIEIYTDLIGRKPKSDRDRRVIELAQLALGRLYYEADQFSRSIDAYLLIDRHSDLFADALYEVSWVYVKNKQYDKALRSLDLLSRAHPESTKTPTVRLLEGNLHIRKAQRVREEMLNGTLDTNDKSDPSTEYTKAAAVFDETKAQYAPSYEMLVKLIDSNVDPGQFVGQISHRDGAVFQTAVPMPEAAADLLRQEPEVQRIVQVESDLGEIQANLELTASLVARLEAIIATGDKITLYPLLAAKRNRAIQIEELLIGIRDTLADQQENLVTATGDLPALAAKRHELSRQYIALNNPEQAYVDRRIAQRKQLETIEKTAGEAGNAIDSAQAMSIAIRKYAASTDPKTTPEQKTAALQQLDNEAKEAGSIEGELGGLRTEIEMSRDLAGVNDADLAAARALRRALMDAQDAELTALSGFASASRDPGHSQKLASTAARATAVVSQLRAIETAVDKRVDDGIAAAQKELVTDTAQLATYRAELAELEAEGKNLGGVALATAFRNVKAKLDDIVVRADVGAIDTSWSQKSDSDDDLKRLNLTRAREMKQLKDEFRDILEANTPKPKKKPVSDLPAADTNTPATSPDKGGDTRVKTGGGTQPAPTPAVKPDAAKPDPKKPDPKAPKGGSK